MYCRNCGKQIADNAEFCPYCGRYVTGFDEERGRKSAPAENAGNAGGSFGWSAGPRTGDNPCRNAGMNYGWGNGPDFRREYYRIRETEGFASASLTCGILSLILGVFFVPEILAIVFGVIAQRVISKNPAKFRDSKTAIAGIILGVIGTILTVIFYVYLFTNYSSEIREALQQYFAGSSAAMFFPRG
ncbi:MAG: DUF4190 domain-containing protein [Bilifractor sp.]|jgi:hypothetical protein